MAAVSDGNDKSLEDVNVDYDLQRHLKGVNTRTPDLSTLAQKGDEKVMQVSFLNVRQLRLFPIIFKDIFKCYELELE